MFNSIDQILPDSAGGKKVIRMHDLPKGLTMKQIREAARSHASRSYLYHKIKKIRGRNLLVIRMSMHEFTADDLSFADDIKGCSCEDCSSWYKESGK